MPLTRSREKVLPTASGVEFLMQDDGVEMRCEATQELLATRFDSNDTPLGQLRAFLFNRSIIERAASVKYDAGDIDLRTDRGVIVDAGDMASPLSRKL